MTTTTNNLMGMDAPKVTRLLGVVVTLFLLLLSGLAALATPVMTLPSSVTIPEDDATNLVFSVSDTDTNLPLFTTSITASSSNPTLVPSANLAVSGAGATRFLAITPALHAYGTATITLIAVNGNMERATNTFTLNVTFVNYLPTFTAVVANRTIREDAGSTNFTFSIADVETALSNLTVTATSTNTTLVPNGNLTLSGTTANRTLNLTAVTNLSGTSLISIIVTDGGSATASNNFLLTVLSVNDAPTFSISTNRIDQSEDAGLTTVSNFLSAISNGPSNESSQSNWLVLNYTTNFFAQAPAVDSNGTFTFTVATNSNGTNSISFVLADDGGTANGGRDRTTNTLTLAVASVNDVPVFTTNVSSLTISEDAGRTNLSFSIFDGDHALTALTVTATSTNTSLVPTNGFTFTGTSSNRTVGITALTNAFGTTEISLIVSDGGGGSDTNTFLLTVTSVADAPILGGATNRTFLEDAITNLTGVISLYDADTAITNVGVTLSSSDTNIVAVAFSATNNVSSNSLTLTLSYTLKTNSNGSAMISVIANDGGVSTTNSFVTTVTAVNDVPAFTVSTNLVLVAEDAGTITNASFFTGISTGPTNESAQTWAFTVTSGTNFSFATAPAITTNGTLTFRTATNAIGTNVITVVMKDSGGLAGGGVDSVTNTFSIGITPVNDAPTFTGVTSKTILEDATTNNTSVVNVIDTDTVNTNVSVTVSSSDTNIATVAITSTNSISTTNSALTLTFTPNTNANGTATITLIATDGALSTTNNLVLTVTPVNDVPAFTVGTNLVFVTEDAGTITNASFLNGLSAGPTNESAQTWTFSVTSGTNFSFATAPAISTNGTLTFRAATNAIGTNTITVVMKDSGGVTSGGLDSVTNTFSIGVTPVNDAPYYVGLAQKTILEDTTTNTVVFNVVDVDTANSGVSLTAYSSDTNIATVAITTTNAIGTTNLAFTLTLSARTNVNDTTAIILIATDGTLSTTNSCVVVISPVNDAPSFAVSTNLVLVAEDAGTITNASFLTAISNGPTNESAQTWTFTVTSGTNFSFATAPTISTNGTLTFRSATNAVGTNTITVVMKDSGGVTGGGVDSVTNTFSIGVIPANDAPTFSGIVSKTILEDATTNTTAVVNAIDTDTASSNLVVTVSSSDTNIATVAITSTNIVNSTNAAFTLTFTPKTNANGSVSITLIGSDGALNTTNSFLLTVTAVNDQPAFTISTNLVLLAEDAGFVTNANFLTGISTGPTNEAAQTWAFTVTPGTNFSFATAPAISTNGTLTFRSATNAIGTNTITVVMKDSGGVTGGGADSITNTFSIGVISANDAPTFLGVVSRTILEDAMTNNTAVINVIDTDTASSNLVVTATSSDTNIATVAITSTNIVNGTNAAITIIFTPKTNANGSVSITLIGTDGALSTTNSFLLTVTAVNDAPDFTVSTNLIIVAEDAGTITNASFIAGISNGPTNESNQTWMFTVTSGTNFAFATAPAISTNGTLTFRTATNSIGTNTITVVMKDNGGVTSGGRDSVTNTFSIGVTPVNDAPTFSGIVAKTILEDATTNTTAVINLIDTDTASSNLVVTATSSDTNLVIVAITSTNIVNSTNAALTLTFTPKTNANGSASITMVGTDGTLSTTNSFLLTITAVNDQPAFTVSTNLLIVAEDAGTITNVSFLTAINNGPTNESAQTWTFTVTSGTNFSFATAPVISTNGTLTFRSATNAIGTNTITVVMKDSGGVTGGGVDSVTNTFSIVLTPVNDAPAFTSLVSKTILEDATTNTTAVINVIDTDTASSNLVVTATSSDTNIATIAITSTNIVNSTNAALTLTFTPKTNANGSVSITLVGNDGALSITNSFLLTVTAVNDAPDFTVSTNLVLLAEDAGFVTNANFLTGISTGPTNEAAQTFAFTVTSGTNFGYVLAPIINTNGTLIFKTATNAVGTNLITVVMKDGGGVASGGVDSVTNTFSIAATSVNDAPTFTGIASKTIREDATSTNTAVVNVLDSDTAITNISVTVSSSDTNIATVAITSTNIVNSTNAALTLTFTPKTNAIGSVSITLVATDGSASATNSFLLTASSVNDAPSFTLSTNLVLIAEDAGAITNASFVTGLSSGPTNESNQSWSFLVTSTTNFAFASAPTISTNGTLNFRTATNAVGTNTLTIVMKDTGGVSSGGVDSYTNTFTLAVTPVNDAAYFTGLATKTIFEDSTTNLTSVVNVIDVDSSSTNLVVTVSSSDTNIATVAITSTNLISSTNGQYTLTYAPKTNANGSVTITLIADDGSATSTNSFLLAVNAVNDIPSFNLAIGAQTVDKYNVAVTVANAVTNIGKGAFNETNQIVSFVMSNSNAGLFTSQPAISTNGTLTFTPAAKGGVATVTVRAKDNAGVANGGVDTSAAQTFTITVPPNPFVALGGAYAGLFFDTNALANDSSGYFRLTLATNGAFTGGIARAGSSNAFSGQFSPANPTLSIVVSNTPCVINMALDISGNWTESISGTVSNTTSGWSANLLGFLNVNAGSFPAARAGEYLVAIPGNTSASAGPPGASTLSFIVDTDGSVSVSGYLADDTLVTQNTHISRNGAVPFYVGLGATGSASGWLTFLSGGTTHLQNDSEVVFIRGSGAEHYSSGFTNATVAVGSLYDNTATDLLTVSSGSVVLSGGGLSTPITNTYTLANNVITIDPSATNGVTLTMFRASGQVSGTFTSGGQTGEINSVILQSTNAARGYFVLPGGVGKFLLY